MIKTVLCSIGGFFHDEKSSLANKKDEFFTKMGPNIFFAKHFCFKSVISKIWEIFFDAYYLSVWQKLAILKIRLTIVTVMILGSLEAAPEEALQLRGLIKGSNWSLGHYLFGRHEFWKFWPPIAQIPGGVQHGTPPSWSPPKKGPALIGLILAVLIRSTLQHRLSD